MVVRLDMPCVFGLTPGMDEIRNLSSNAALRVVEIHHVCRTMSQGWVLTIHLDTRYVCRFGSVHDEYKGDHLISPRLPFILVLNEA